MLLQDINRKWIYCHYENWYKRNTYGNKIIDYVFILILLNKDILTKFIICKLLNYELQGLNKVKIEKLGQLKYLIISATVLPSTV